MSNFNQTPLDVKQTLKRGFIYLLIAFPFVLVVATIMTIIKAPLWAVLLCNVIAGAGVVAIAMIINNKIKEKKAKEKDIKPKEFDPFRD